MEAHNDGLDQIATLSAQLEKLSRKLDTVSTQQNREPVPAYDYSAGSYMSHQEPISYGQAQYGVSMPTVSRIPSTSQIGGITRALQETTIKTNTVSRVQFLHPNLYTNLLVYKNSRPWTSWKVT